MWISFSAFPQLFKNHIKEVVEDDSRICVSLSLSATGVERARREASARGVSLSALVDEYFATL